MKSKIVIIVLLYSIQINHTFSQMGTKNTSINFIVQIYKGISLSF